MKRSGILFVLSAASGAGKTTLCNGLRGDPHFRSSISCTTRSPRRGEVDGKDYFFLTEGEFLRRVREGFFLEHARVHGNHYGTPLPAVKETLQKGHDLLLVIDVQGAAQVRDHPDETIRASLVDIFLMTPTVAELERRLRGRGADDEATIRRRLAAAGGEMSHWPKYRYVILSGSPEEDVRNFLAIADAERQRTSRMKATEITEATKLG